MEGSIVTEQEHQKNDRPQPTAQPDPARGHEGSGESRESPTEPRRDQLEAHPPGTATPS